MFKKKKKTETNIFKKPAEIMNLQNKFGNCKIYSFMCNFLKFYVYFLNVIFMCNLY